MYAGQTQKLTQVRNPGNVVLVYETGTSHRGGMVCVLFADGHVQTMSPAALAPLLKPTTTPTVPLEKR